jgi:AcrR family transcriptional regulator
MMKSFFLCEHRLKGPDAMENEKNSTQKWIDAAYHEFATNGPDFSINDLAKKSNLPRASLYYHVASKEELLEELLLLHQEKVNRYLSQLEGKVKNVIPDLYKFVYAHKTEILFHRQLLLNSHREEFYVLYKSANQRSMVLLLPQIKGLFDTTGSNEEFIRFYHTLTDTWYIRLDPNDFTVESLMSLATDIMENTLGLFSGTIRFKKDQA